jgi:elongator complex protein 3
VLAGFKALVPPWVRIQRIQRDIPARLIAAGVRSSNIRELALRRLRSDGGSCRCLRCREVERKAVPAPEDLVLTETDYSAAGGRERFLAWEDPATDAIAGFLRLRFPSGLTEGGLSDPVIRELKVLGTERSIGAPAAGAYQHRGLGSALLDRAEAHAREAGFDRILVTSAVGTREYYRRRGYRPAGPHMAKPTYSGRNLTDGKTAVS